MHSQTRPDKTALGIMLIVLAVFMMSIQDSLFKHFSAELSLWQTFTLRALFALPLLVVIALATGKKRNPWSGAVKKWPLLRSLFMTLMFIAMYGSMPFLSLSTVAAGIYTGPVFVTLLSGYALGEPVGQRGWIAVALGFIGVLVILQPGTDAFTFWALLPVLAGLFYALSIVTTRGKCQDASPAELVLSLNMALLFTGLLLSGAILFSQPADEIASLFPSILGGWSAVDASGWLLIGLLAVLVVGIGMALAGAYQSASPSIVVTFDYSYLLFVALWDYLFFSIAPSVTTTLGISLIVTAGFLALRRVRKTANRSNRSCR